MDNPSFRPAIPAERTALEGLQRRASLVWEDYRDALLENPDAMDLPLNQITDGQTIVAQMRDEIVGFAVVLPRDDGHAELDGLFVEPNVWRRGIGRGLIERAQALGSTKGATTLFVVANPRAQDFYKTCGRRIGEAPTRFGIGLVMRRGPFGAVS
jgi:GNAT superfamily N-acetyltransferase